MCPLLFLVPTMLLTGNGPCIIERLKLCQNLACASQLLDCR
ncbi:hypothetical protein GLYMA_14G154150v4 [Glycine max]|nr:hypothetical protein GLYMA_14G154150v4 [Glycine max]KAH1094630.1 hypothetical protein GYH30_040080 [Glycine max]